MCARLTAITEFSLDQDDFTFGGKVRLSAAVLLFLLSLLIPFPAPTYTLWKLEIAVTEWSYYTALLALILLIPGWRYGRYSLTSSIIAFGVFCINAAPLVRAFRLAENLPETLEQQFGQAVPRFLVPAPALIKPITLRLLFTDPPSPDVEVKLLNYASHVSGFMQLNLYKSTAISSPRPVVVVIHGGSWRGGTREDLPALSFYLAARGYAVASISYRLAPRFRHPAQTEDVNGAIDYLKSHSAPLGIDASRIALLGRSAGGHLALLSAYTKHDPDIKGVVALYPPTDQVWGYQNPSRIIESRQILRDYLGGTPLSSPQVYAATSPVNHVRGGSPPTLLIHGTKDELVSVRESRMLSQRLTAYSRPHVLMELPWATHGCDYLFNGPCGQLSTYAVERFLAAVLR